jgi:hypothetical protein
MNKFGLTFVLLLGLLSACNRQSLTKRNNLQEFQFSIIDYSEIGYGSVYTIETDEKPSRKLALTVLAGEDSLLPGPQFGQHNLRFEGRFAFDSDHAPYRTMPITGFVDDQMKVWKLEALQWVPPAGN